MELDGSGNILDKYIRGINLIKNNSSYFLFNAHGDVVHLTDSAGAVTKRYHYDAFGNEVSPSASDGNPWRYCGEYFDLSSGTYYLRNRYYNPSNGRFLTEDSYRGNPDDPLSLNLYTYCHNNPVAYTDPSGNAPYSTKRYDGRYELYVSPQWLDMTQTAAGLIPFFTPVNYLAQRFIGDYRGIGMDWWSLVGTLTNVADTALKTPFGYVGTGLEASFRIYDWIFTNEYQISEAVFNHFDRKAWISDSRDLVDTKYRYAMEWMTYNMVLGNIEVKKAIDVFGKSAFGNSDKTYQYDPLTGKNKYFNKNDYYFFMLNDSMEDYIKGLENIMFEGIWFDFPKR